MQNLLDFKIMCLDVVVAHVRKAAERSTRRKNTNGLRVAVKPERDICVLSGPKHRILQSAAAVLVLFLDLFEKNVLLLYVFDLYLFEQNALRDECKVGQDPVLRPACAEAYTLIFERRPLRHDQFARANLLDFLEPGHSTDPISS